MEDPHTRYSKRLVSNWLRLASLNAYYLAVWSSIIEVVFYVGVYPIGSSASCKSVHLTDIDHFLLAHCVTVVATFALCPLRFV